MTEYKLTDEYITLGQLLKDLGIISTGGQAKYYLQDNAVLLNGETENRRGKKLYPDDILIIDDQNQIKIVE